MCTCMPKLRVYVHMKIGTMLQACLLYVLCVPCVGTAARCPRGGAKTVQMRRCGVCVAKACDPERDQTCWPVGATALWRLTFKRSRRIKDVRIQRKVAADALDLVDYITFTLTQQVKVIFSQRSHVAFVFAGGKTFVIYVAFFLSLFYAAIIPAAFTVSASEKKGPEWKWSCSVALQKYVKIDRTH